MSARRLYRSGTIYELTGIRERAARQMELRGLFPQRVKLNPSARGGSVAWIADEVDAWIDERIAARNQTPSN